MSFDLDAAILFYAADPVRLSAILKAGMLDDMIVSPAVRNAFTIARAQFTSGHGVPTAADLFGISGVVPLETNFGPLFLVEEAAKRYDFGVLKAAVSKIEAGLANNDPIAATAVLAHAQAEVRHSKITGGGPTNLFSYGEQVKARAEEAESGALHVPFPWPSLNKMTGGMVPGTNTWFLARPGTGKTWVLVIQVLNAWLQSQNDEEPKRFLVITPEMSNVDIAERICVMKAGVPYGAVVGGTLGDFVKPKYFEVVDELATKTGIWVLDGSDGITPEKIEAAILDLNIDVLMIDAAYKIKWNPKARDRSENLVSGVEWISKWSKRKWPGDRMISSLITSQLNKDGAKKATEAAVGLTDTINWEADSLFFLEKDQSPNKGKLIKVVTSKCRRSAVQIRSVTFKLDMVGMDFSEVSSEDGNGFTTNTAPAEEKWMDHGF